VFSPPSDLEPAVVSVLVGGAGPGDRSAVAAVLLGLAERGAIDIDGTDSRRYTLAIPAGERGDVFEEVVLSELRPQGQKTSTATLTRPPLWGAGGASVERRLARVAGSAAREARLIRVTLTAWLRANSQLHEVGAPGSATWGEPLVYATVLGAAPTAAGSLGTG